MGVSIEAFRARIGLHFHRVKARSTLVARVQPHPRLPMVVLPAAVLLILLLIAGVEPNPGPDGAYKCKYCNLAFKTTSLYSKHVMVHSHWRNFGIQCCFCKLNFKSAASFDSHVTRFHREMRTNAKDAVRNSQPPAMFTCPVDSCNEKLNSREDYMSHVPSHFTGQTAYQCKLGTCKSKLSERRQFQIHMSRFHPVATFHGTSSSGSNPANNESSETVSVSEDTNQDDEMAMDLGDSSASHADTTTEDPYPENIIKDDIARFYLKLEGEYLLATSTIQEISIEIQRLTEYSHHCMKRALKQQLDLLDLPDPVMKSIMHSAFKSDPVFNVHHKDHDIEHLATDYLRNKYWRKAFPFVQPEEIYFGVNESGKKRVAQYVSIRETLQILLKDDEIKKMVLQSFERKDGNGTIFQDYYDGSAYTAHKCQHVEGNKCLQLLLFEDAFDFAAFGPSAGVHKPIGFYYTLGNMPAEHRSKVDLIQLAYMVLEKDTRPTMQEELDDKDILKDALSPLLDELKLLKSEGIEIDGEKIPVCLLFLIGDSLGQHTVGGYVKSFSAEFTCRFCEMSRTQFLATPYEVKPFRTPDQYNGSVRLAKVLYDRRKKEALKVAQRTFLRNERRKQSEGASSSSSVTAKKLLMSKHAFKKVIAVNHKGVKYRPSPFNSNVLKFHVSTPALPPCLAHDIFEGILKCVLSRILDYFIQTKKWFDLKTLNRRIKRFKCLGSDALDPPKPLKAAHELSGNACQNWNLLRLLPFIIGPLIKDKEDPVWRLYVSLKEIVEYVCAPKISIDQVAYLKSIIRSYLCTLKNLQEYFPKCLIPKQHFLAHYPDLIELFGPLIRLWTMRYESKHMFFKRVAKVCRNYINITHTLARKHMCKFAYDHASGLLPPEVEYKQSHVLMVSALPKEKLNALPQNFRISSVEFLSSVLVKSISYERGFFLLLDSVQDTSDLLFGRIDSIMVNGMVPIKYYF